MKKEDRDIFVTNPQKASAKVTINSFMMGSLFFIFTLIWTLNPQKFSLFIVAQIVLAIPLLFVSSLAYAKIGYREQTKLWDTFGWFTNNTGTIFILNAVGLMTITVSRELALLYFATIVVLMAMYSSINLIHKPTALWEKFFKFLFFVAILSLGGIAPLFFGLL